MIYNPVSQPLPYPVNTQCQHGDEQHLQTNPTLLHGPSGPHIQPTIISAPPPSNSMPFGISIRKARALIILGVAQVILGILSIVFNGAGYYVHTTYTFYGPGLWAGVPVSTMQCRSYSSYNDYLLLIFVTPFLVLVTHFLINRKKKKRRQKREGMGMMDIN